jgi:hypothetical protein
MSDLTSMLQEGNYADTDSNYGLWKAADNGSDEFVH